MDKVLTADYTDTSVPRHFGTKTFRHGGAEVSDAHFGNGAEMSGHFGPVFMAGYC